MAWQGAYRNLNHLLIADKVSDGQVAQAVKLYNQKAYGPATDAFEQLLRTAVPEPGLYYYAALANRGSQHENRAKQLFQYIVANFPQSLQATYARSTLGIPAPGVTTPGSASKSQAPEELPEAVKAQLSPEMQNLLKTPMGEQGRAGANETEC